MLKDKFSDAFAVGVIAAVLADLWNYLAHFIKLASLRYIDFASILTLGKPPQSTLELIYSQLVQLGFAGVMGIGFAYLLPKISAKHLYLKGLLFGNGVWFLAYLTTTLFKTPHLTSVPVKTAIANLVSASIYGFALSYLQKYVYQGK